MSIIRGLIGIFVLIFIAFLFSKNRRAIDWKLVGIGLSLQLLVVLGMLYLPVFQQAVAVIAHVFVKVLSFSKAGSVFLFGSLADGQSFGYVFAFQIFPTIIFFSALTSLLYYLNVIQWVIKGISWVLRKTLKISGAEGLVTSSNIFVGVAEAPMLIKGFLPQMNPSELFLLMTAGMATIAGGVMAAYVGMLGGNDPASQILFAKHLIAASTMAAPGAVVMSKIIMPQTDKVSDVAVLSRYDMGKNMLDAIANGAIDGLRLSASIGAILLVFISFIAFANYLLSYFIGDTFGLNEKVATLFDGRITEFNFQFILGVIFSPIAWLMGVCKEDMFLVGQLLGEKIVLNEFVGYQTLTQLKSASAFVEDKSIIMSTYMLCGFANIGTIAIMIGGIGTLAPMHRGFLTKYGFHSVIAGALVSCMSATMIGMII